METYDWRGLLTARAAAGVTTNYVYNLDGSLHAEQDATNADRVVYGYDERGRLARQTTGGLDEANRPPQQTYREDLEEEAACRRRWPSCRREVTPSIASLTPLKAPFAAIWRPRRR